MNNPVIQVLSADSALVVLTDKQELLLADWIENAKSNNLTDIITIKEVSVCGVFLKDGGKDVPCLAVAEDELGNWCVLTLDGCAKQYLHSEIL